MESQVVVVAQAVGNGLVVVSAVLAALIIVVYHVTARWWESEAGRHIMAFTAAVAAVLGLASVRIVAGAGLDTAWFVVLRVAVFASVPVVLAWRFGIVLRDQAIPAWRHWRAVRR